MKRAAAVVLLSGLIALLTLGLSGCSSGSSAQPIGVSVTSSVAGNAIDQGQTVSLTASVTNDSKNAGVTWSVSGTSGSQGTLSGQSTTAVTYNAPATVTSAFTATVTATSITDTTKSASVQIKVNPLPAIASTPLPTAHAGTAYSATPGETGGTGPFLWTVTPTLPAGLTLNASTGLISGTPTGGGSGSFTFKVTDAAGNSATQTLTITVDPPLVALSVTTASLPGAGLGVAYSQTVQATGGVPSYQWSLTGGSLPAGLTLSSAGVISGTPTGGTGTSHFTVTVTDSQTPTPKTSSAALSITVALAPLSVATTSLVDGVKGNAYSQTLQASGGTPPYTNWAITAGALPANLTLNAGTGAITGTPTATGTSNFTVKVTDSAADTATANLSITVNGALAITTTSLPAASVGAAYSATVAATGGLTPYTWSLSGNPSWLSINPSTGALSGTPTATGKSTFTVEVADSENPQATASASLSITIAAQGCTNNGALNGNYAFVSSGWSSSTTTTSLAGSFLADANGNLTSGLLDIADQANPSGPQSGTFTGSYCVNANNLATLTLTYGGGLSGGDTLVAALDSSDSNGHIISYDSSDRKVSGLLRQQTVSAFSTSKIDGNYAFGLVGTDPIGNRFAMAGEFSSDGKGNLLGEDDSDDSGATETAQTLNASDFSVVSTGASAGRGTATITSSIGNTNFVFYVVSSSEMLMMAIDTETPPVIVAGQVLQQQSSAFTDASLDGIGVIELQSLGSNGNLPSVTVGLLTATGAGSFSISADQNQGGTMGTLCTSGSYSVSATTGRVMLSNVEQCGGGSSGGGVPVFYLVGPNQAFVVGTDGAATFGTIEPQTGSNFNLASLTGNYLGGSQPPETWSVGEEVDSVTSDGKGNFTSITSDDNGSGGTSTNHSTATYTVASNGRVIVNQSGVPAVYLYLVSTSQAVALPVSSTQNPDTNPKLTDFHQ